MSANPLMNARLGFLAADPDDRRSSHSPERDLWSAVLAQLALDVELPPTDLEYHRALTFLGTFPSRDFQLLVSRTYLAHVDPGRIHRALLDLARASAALEPGARRARQRRRTPLRYTRGTADRNLLGSKKGVGATAEPRGAGPDPRGGAVTGTR